MIELVAAAPRIAVNAAVTAATVYIHTVSSALADEYIFSIHKMHGAASNPGDDYYKIITHPKG
jgi:hypothetical protein